MAKRNVLAAFFDPRKEAISDEIEIEETAAEDNPRIGPKPKPLNPAHLQQANTLAKIVEDLNAAEKALEQREIEVRQTREQMKNFKSFVRDSEVDFETIVRLSEEREALSNEAARLDTDNGRLKSSLEEERARADATKNRADEMRTALEESRSDIVELIERDAQYREEIETITSDLNASESEHSKISSANDKLRAENEVLVSRVEHTQADLTAYQRKFTELKKEHDEITAKREIELDQQEHLSNENSAVQKSLIIYQSENAELQSQMSNLQLEQDALRRQLSEKIRIREEELYSLRAKVNSINSDIRVKSQVILQARDDLSIAGSEVKAAKDLVNELHQRLAAEKAKSEQYEEQVSAANTEVSVISVKYDSVLANLDDARKENERLTRALKIESQKMEFMMDPTTTRNGRASNGNGRKASSDESAITPH